jgi:hypothetical protein
VYKNYNYIVTIIWKGDKWGYASLEKGKHNEQVLSTQKLSTLQLITVSINYSHKSQSQINDIIPFFF